MEIFPTSNLLFPFVSAFSAMTSVPTHILRTEHEVTLDFRIPFQPSLIKDRFLPVLHSECVCSSVIFKAKSTDHQICLRPVQSIPEVKKDFIMIHERLFLSWLCWNIHTLYKSNKGIKLLVPSQESGPWYQALSVPGATGFFILSHS